MTMEISLTQGLKTLVDDEDYEWLTQWKWSAHGPSKTGVWYASRGIWLPDEKRVKGQPMHRIIMDAHEDITVDHIDGDGLNNQRSNLRLATKQQQAPNRSLRSDNKSGYKGVYWVYTNPTKTKGKWRALIKAEGRRLSLGLYDDPYEASLAYEKAAEKYYGEWRRKL